MKGKTISIICFLLIFVMIASSCNSDETVETEPTEATEASETVKNDQTELCPSDNHDYVEVSRIDALALKDGEIKYQCSRCKKESVEKIEATKSLKILALGNSFTDDSTWHLWNICRDAGVKDLIVANLYVGNCNLDQHWDHIYNNKNPYIYRKTVSGTRVDKNNYKVIDALKDEDWDFIVLHQTSGSAGQIETFDNLDLIVRFMNSNKTNPNAKILWHMPWAYQSDSTHGEFGKYDKDQTKMYETIVERVNEIIVPDKKFSAIIPSGTAIQNLRTSYVGDNVTRDGYHLDYGFGRYTAGLTWYAVLTGGDVDAPNWVPGDYPEVVEYLPVIRESVKNALANKFEVTESKLKTPEEGYDLSDYELLEWDYVENAHWNCSASTSIVRPSSSDTTLYNTNLCVDRMYSIEELPVGTIFVCDYGWRFRLEQYKNKTDKYTGARHAGCVDSFFVLTDKFLNGCQYLAWSVSANPRKDISEVYEEAQSHIRIYIPK